MEEFKHFSHSHGLVFHQMPQDFKIRCSGCKLPGLANTYACWECNHFLHEQCFNASQSLKHPSHTPHPLTLVPYPTYSSRFFSCNFCNLEGNGFAYSCSKCQFDLHVHCALNPTAKQNDGHHPHTPIYPVNQNSNLQNYPLQNDTQNGSIHPQTPINTSVYANPDSIVLGNSGSTHQNNPQFFQPNVSVPNYGISVSTPFSNPSTNHYNSMQPSLSQQNPQLQNYGHQMNGLLLPQTSLPQQNYGRSVSALSFNQPNPSLPNYDSRVNTLHHHGHSLGHLSFTQRNSPPPNYEPPVKKSYIQQIVNKLKPPNTRGGQDNI